MQSMSVMKGTPGGNNNGQCYQQHSLASMVLPLSTSSSSVLYDDSLIRNKRKWDEYQQLSTPISSSYDDEPFIKEHEANQSGPIISATNNLCHHRHYPQQQQQKERLHLIDSSDHHQLQQPRLEQEEHQQRLTMNHDGDDRDDSHHLGRWNQNKKRKSVAKPRPTVTVPPRVLGPVCEIREHDVLAGRGGKVNSHRGNVLFRQMIADRRSAYRSIHTKKLDKAFIAADIVYTIRNSGGRFLKFDSNTNMWYDIGDERAIKKTGQAIREDISNFNPTNSACTSPILHTSSTFEHDADNEDYEHHDSPDTVNSDHDTYRYDHSSNIIDGHPRNDGSSTTSTNNSRDKLVHQMQQDREQQRDDDINNDNDDDEYSVIMATKKYMPKMTKTKETRHDMNTYDFGLDVVDRVPVSPLHVLSQLATAESFLPINTAAASTSSISKSTLAAVPSLSHFTTQEGQPSPPPSSLSSLLLASLSHIATVSQSLLQQHQQQYQQHHQQQALPPVYVMTYPSGSLQSFSDVVGSSNIRSSHDGNISNISSSVMTSLLSSTSRNDSPQLPSLFTTVDSSQQQQSPASPFVFVFVLPSQGVEE